MVPALPDKIGENIIIFKEYSLSGEENIESAAAPEENLENAAAPEENFENAVAPDET